MSLMPTDGGGSIFQSPFLPALAIAFSSGLKAFGAYSAGKGVVTSAERRAQAAEFEAQQLVVNAGQAKAAAQRDAYFKGLEGEQLISAIRARAGAGASDPTVLNIIGSAMARRAYNMQAANYAGEDKARTMTMQAAAKRYDATLGIEDARRARSAYNLSAVGSIAEGATSLYQKYWAKNDVTESSGSFGGITPGQGYSMEFTP